MNTETTLACARTAYLGGDWPTARAAFRAALDEGGLEAEDLARLGMAEWWLGDAVASMEIAEDVYRIRLANHSIDQAALGALELALMWTSSGNVIIGTAWLGRARRLLIGRPPSRVGGYLAYLEASAHASVDGDLDSAQRAAKSIADAAARFDDPALACFSLVVTGLAHVRAGDIDAGFAVLDEAMLHILAGVAPPIWSGDVYCGVLHLCHVLSDLARMRAWTDAMERWASPLSRHFTYYGVARVHRLQLCSAGGDWDIVEQEIGGESERLADGHGWVAGEGFRELGDVRRLRGDTAGARDAYDRTRALGVAPQPGEALLMAAEGDAAEALELLRESAAELGPLGGTNVVSAAVQVALDLGDRAEAERLASTLAMTADRYPSPGMRATADVARARVLLAQGRWDAAHGHLRSAATTYREQRFRYAVAEVHELIAAALRGRGEPRAAASEEATALAIYRRLGARPDVARLAGGQRPGGLTARELEVLAYVSSGASNRRVAENLVISEKTVGRHLANIYAKVGVTSRTAAAAWARDHGVDSRAMLRASGPTAFTP